MHLLVGDSVPADPLYLLLLFLMVLTCSMTRRLPVWESPSDGSASDVSPISPRDKADLKGSSVILDTRLLPRIHTRTETNGCVILRPWFSSWLTQVAWSSPVSSLLGIHTLPPSLWHSASQHNASTFKPNRFNGHLSAVNHYTTKNDLLWVSGGKKKKYFLKKKKKKGVNKWFFCFFL